MAYTHFLDGKPDATVTGSALPSQINDQMKALRDALVALAMYGWNYSASLGNDGTYAQPVDIHYKKGTEWIRKTYTWGYTGGATNNVASVVFEYSSNSGVDWETIGTCTYSYDSGGICIASVWS